MKTIAQIEANIRSFLNQPKGTIKSSNEMHNEDSQTMRTLLGKPKGKLPTTGHSFFSSPYQNLFPYGRVPSHVSRKRLIGRIKSQANALIPDGISEVRG